MFQGPKREPKRGLQILQVWNPFGILVGLLAVLVLHLWWARRLKEKICAGKLEKSSDDAKKFRHGEKLAENRARANAKHYMKRTARARRTDWAGKSRKVRARNSTLAPLNQLSLNHVGSYCYPPPRWHHGLVGVTCPIQASQKPVFYTLSLS